jgi:cyclomaltodextrinase / maltogenic alpha-amylase / neopullulanase
MDCGRRMVRVTGWADTAIFWHVYPLGFVGAPRSARPEAIPRVRRLDNWLDYVIELGANGLLLGPVFASETHGYDTVDHYRVDPRLGTEGDLLELFAQASGRGIRVVLDGVFNHVGRGFPQLKDVRDRGAESAFRSWFHRRPDGSFDTFEGHERLVTLNHDEPAVVEYVVDVMCHWLDRGADGWRLDAAYAVPTAFWRQVTDRVRARHPDAWLLAEVIHGDYTAFVNESGVDSLTQYELWKAIWSSLNDGNFFELAWALKRHEQLLDGFVPQTFLGNHDVTRIASQLVDHRHLAHALVLLLTTAGIPSIYAGDEQGMVGLKEQREGGDDSIRPAFPDHPELRLPAAEEDMLSLHRELISLRRRHPWLVRARTVVEHLTNEQLLLRATDGKSSLLVALNLGEPDVFVLPSQPWRLVSGRGQVAGNCVFLAARGWCVLAPDETAPDTTAALPVVE